jgi:hypothetical protein
MSLDKIRVMYVCMRVSTDIVAPPDQRMRNSLEQHLELRAFPCRSTLHASLYASTNVCVYACMRSCLYFLCVHVRGSTKILAAKNHLLLLLLPVLFAARLANCRDKSPPPPPVRPHRLPKKEAIPACHKFSKVSTMVNSYRISMES